MIGLAPVIMSKTHPTLRLRIARGDALAFGASPHQQLIETFTFFQIPEFHKLPDRKYLDALDQYF